MRGVIRKIEKGKTKAMKKDKFQITVNTEESFFAWPEVVPENLDVGDEIEFDAVRENKLYKIVKIKNVKKGGEIKRANELLELDKIISYGAEILGRCAEKVARIYGVGTVDKLNDAQIRCVNSLFIWATKELYFRGEK